MKFIFVIFTYFCSNFVPIHFQFIFQKSDDDVKATFGLPADILELLTENTVRDHKNYN